MNTHRGPVLMYYYNRDPEGHDLRFVAVIPADSTSVEQFQPKLTALCDAMGWNRDQIRAVRSYVGSICETLDHL